MDGLEEHKDGGARVGTKGLDHEGPKAICHRARTHVPRGPSQQEGNLGHGPDRRRQPVTAVQERIGSWEAPERVARDEAIGLAHVEGRRTRGCASTGRHVRTPIILDVRSERDPQAITVPRPLFPPNYRCRQCFAEFQ
eukprot:4519283-Prymnesium_polylepis.4